jgi:hypothetical protein
MKNNGNVKMKYIKMPEKNQKEASFNKFNIGG